MSDSRLTRGLDLLTLGRAAPREVPHCSFCGVTTSALFLGPVAQLCEQCAVIACGMFLAAARDNLSMEADYRTLFARACADYGRNEHEPLRHPLPGRRMPS